MQVKVEMPELARNSKYILVDFVLPNYKNEEVWIEYNGSQHYHYNGRYQRSQQDFEHQQRRDRVMRAFYCETHHIRLIEIKHSLNYIGNPWRLFKKSII